MLCLPYINPSHPLSNFISFRISILARESCEELVRPNRAAVPVNFQICVAHTLRFQDTLSFIYCPSEAT
jgi:hypothetical protein